MTSSGASAPGSADPTLSSTAARRASAPWACLVGCCPVNAPAPTPNPRPPAPTVPHDPRLAQHFPRALTLGSNTGPPPHSGAAAVCKHAPRALALPHSQPAPGTQGSSAFPPSPLGQRFQNFPSGREEPRTQSRATGKSSRTRRACAAPCRPGRQSGPEPPGSEWNPRGAQRRAPAGPRPSRLLARVPSPGPRALTRAGPAPSPAQRSAGARACSLIPRLPASAATLVPLRSSLAAAAPPVPASLRRLHLRLVWSRRRAGWRRAMPGAGGLAFPVPSGRPLAGWLRQ